MTQPGDPTQNDIRWLANRILHLEALLKKEPIDTVLAGWMADEDPPPVVLNALQSLPPHSTRTP